MGLSVLIVLKHIKNIEKVDLITSVHFKVLLSWSHNCVSTSQYGNLILSRVMSLGWNCSI